MSSDAGPHRVRRAQRTVLVEIDGNPPAHQSGAEIEAAPREIIDGCHSRRPRDD